MADHGVYEKWRAFVDWTLAIVGSMWAFLLACAFLITWTAAGVFFAFSDTWQLVLNTVASVVAFVLVFLIQYSQSRDSRALQLKLDELLSRLPEPRTQLVALEHLSDAELDELDEEFKRLRSGSNRDLGAAPGFAERATSQ